MALMGRSSAQHQSRGRKGITSSIGRAASNVNLWGWYAESILNMGDAPARACVSSATDAITSSTHLRNLENQVSAIRKLHGIANSYRGIRSRRSDSSYPCVGVLTDDVLYCAHGISATYIYPPEFNRSRFKPNDIPKRKERAYQTGIVTMFKTFIIFLIFIYPTICLLGLKRGEQNAII